MIDATIINYSNEIQPVMLSLLNKYHRVFDELQGLPPQRTQDHQVSLKVVQKPMNVKPYRYPYFHKAEIERIMAELLNSGMIRPSQSPFSSPVLLVRKYGGSWHMCVLIVGP